MTPFYMAMARSGNARKLYVQVWLICLLLFHYVYACGHMGEFGILLSTGVCAAMFSFRRTDNWLRRLLDRPRAFVTLASGALVIGFVPHLYTLAITIAYLLLAALFYPSVRVMSECKIRTHFPDGQSIPECCQNPITRIITQICRMKRTAATLIYPHNMNH